MLIVFMLVTALVLGVVTPYHHQASQMDDGYSIAEVMTAYEMGQFRVINTHSTNLYTSPDGSYIAASGDGLYRVSDGLYFPQYDTAIFSPNSLYVVQENDGVYRLSDGQQLFEIGALPRFTLNGEYLAAEDYGIFRLSDGEKLFDINDIDANTDGYVYSFYSHFSPNGNFVVIDEDGVYRLSDRQKLFDVDAEGLYVTFSPTEQYAGSGGDGIYRLSDGQKLFNINSYSGFSPNENYAVVAQDGIYSLPDGQKLFDIRGSITTFSPDENYVAIYEDGVYHITTQTRLFNAPSSAIFSPDGSYVAIAEDGVYRLSDRQKHFEIKGFPEIFSDDNLFLAVEGFGEQNISGMYRISDGQNIFPAPYGATFSPDGQYAAVGTMGLYRLSDGQQMFEIENVITNFSSDGNYIISSSAEDDTVYRVSDGHRYPGLKLLNIASGVMAIGNTVLVVDPTQEQQRISFIHVDIDHTLFSEPNTESESLRSIFRGLYLAVLQEQDGWYQVSYFGDTGWVSADDVTRFTVPE